MPSTVGGAGSGGSSLDTLDLKDDLGIDIPGVLYYEVVGEEAGQRVRVNYWQLKGSGDMAQAPRDYTFDTVDVFQNDPTQASLDINIAEVLYEPAFIRTPNFRLRGIVGADLVQFYMTVENQSSTPPATATVSIPSEEGGFLNLGVDYQLLLLLGGSVEYAFKPWLKLVGRTQFFDNRLLSTGDVTGAFLASEVGLVFGAPEGRGFAATVGYRDFGAEYSDGTTDSEAKVSGFLVSVFLAF
jgi:hypothetical protein